MLDGEHDDTAHGDGMGDGDDPVFSREAPTPASPACLLAACSRQVCVCDEALCAVGVQHVLCEPAMSQP